MEISVSVVLPFRNAADTFAECLLSIQQQTLRSFECLCIDDASTDRSARIVQAFAQSDPRFRIISNPQPGLVNALNLGLELAQAPHIARMDADDIMLAGRLEKQALALNADVNLDLIACQVALFPEMHILAGYREYVRWQNNLLSNADIHNAIYTESPFAHPSVMFRKTSIHQLGGYQKGVFPEDYDLWLRMEQAGCRFQKLAEILLRWRDHPRRLSRTAEHCSQTAFDTLRARYLSNDKRLQKRSLVIWGAGRKTRLRTRHFLSHGFKLDAWIDIDPNKINNRLNGVPVVAPDWLVQTPKPFVLCYVRSHGASESISKALHSFGYRCGQDYLVVG